MYGWVLSIHQHRTSGMERRYVPYVPEKDRGDREDSGWGSIHSLLHPSTQPWDPGCTIIAKMVLLKDLSVPKVQVVLKGKYELAAGLDCPFAAPARKRRMEKVKLHDSRVPSLSASQASTVSIFSLQRLTPHARTRIIGYPRHLPASSNTYMPSVSLTDL